MIQLRSPSIKYPGESLQQLQVFFFASWRNRFYNQVLSQKLTMMTNKNRPINKLADFSRFIRFVITQFFEDDCTYRASALAFTTLLAIVPLMSVGLSILSSFPVFSTLKEPVQDFIFTNFVPATGKAVQTYLLQFTEQVSQLSVSGVVFLIVSAILLLVTIETAMNKIWRVSSPRNGVSAFLLYWAILSLGPILLGFSLVASSYFFSMPYVRNHHPPSFLLEGLPFFLSFIGFSFLYIVVPNCRIRIANGLWGGLAAAILFETAKQGFAWYLTRYNSYQLLYGAFAIVPIFFIWIYWVWVVTLIGAEISYALSMSHLRRRGEPIDAMTHALIWLHCLWEKQKNGRGIALQSLIRSDSQPYEVEAKQMINELEKACFVHTDEKGNYHLSRSLDKMRLYEIGEELPFHFPTKPPQLSKTQPGWLSTWYQLIESHQQQTHQALNLCVDELFKQ